MGYYVADDLSAVTAKINHFINLECLAFKSNTRGDKGKMPIYAPELAVLEVMINLSFSFNKKMCLA